MVDNVWVVISALVGRDHSLSLTKQVYIKKNDAIDAWVALCMEFHTDGDEGDDDYEDALELFHDLAKEWKSGGDAEHGKELTWSTDRGRQGQVENSIEKLELNRSYP